ncbi:MULTISPECIES: cation diffusion facilitator family transporter [Acidianus]|uniref:Cation diffusion facilitator family transporter n=1 Tax=Candidatus Acidianus copahuensis TaxID=1160895 RepID=A0A031LJP9_9CREN|nr:MULTISPECIES: cation diffusion facilitator family transporter [Acidianus]EZQ01720.1 cation diffusion facilitator family transporter [Candidatus Acidianus copahuensis]NON61447.1 cation transporter [Acidianus sp. RZ1]
MRQVLWFWITFLVSLCFALTSSSAIIVTEAIHSFMDAAVVTFSSLALGIVNRRSPDYTYGLHRLEVISAISNVLVVILGSLIGGVVDFLFFSFHIVDKPEIVIAASALTALFAFMASLKEENGSVKKSIRIHAISDTVSYLIGLAGGIAVLLTRLYILDPVTSVIILIIMISMNVKNLRAYLDVVMEKSPINTDIILDDISSIIPGTHHVHVWTICEHMRIATLHVEEKPDTTLRQLDNERLAIEKILMEKYGINHVTIQFESKKETKRVD